MARLRIRTLKPEIFCDEAVGRLGAWERLLFIGLITMADDEGRLRCLSSAIAGHVFPYDDVSPAKMRGWLNAIQAAGLVTLYACNDHGYVQIKGWGKHQRVNRPTPSELPAPSLNGVAP